MSMITTTTTTTTMMDVDGFPPKNNLTHPTNHQLKRVRPEMSLEQTSPEKENCISLNVGGKVFVTSKLTLRSSSTYFQARFSNAWNGTDAIFIDQCPDTFEILLRYMREGFIRSDDLNESVVVGAEYFGCDVLLSALRCKVYRAKYPGTSSLSNEVVEHKFVEEFGGTMREALCRGMMYYLRSSSGMTGNLSDGEDNALFEYGHLLQKDKMTAKSVATNGGKTVHGPFGTSLGLTWLYAMGFHPCMGPEMFTFEERTMIRWYFSRPQSRASEESQDQIIERTTTFSDLNKFSEYRPGERKEFAWLDLRNFDNEDEGVMVNVAYVDAPPNNEDAPLYLQNLDKKDVKKVVYGFHKGLQSALRWLNICGFTTREHKLEKSICGVIYCSQQPGEFSHMLFSRSLPIDCFKPMDLRSEDGEWV